MKIGIDARLWRQTGVGRYIRNLVYGLDKIADGTPHTFIIYLTSEDKDVTFTSKKLIKKIADVKWHSLQEQVALLRILNKDDLDLMHFTYYSVPFRYKRPYVITLHDLIIYQYFTGKASTLPYPLYMFKHFAYRYLLRQIKSNSKKIIVPLQSTADEVIRLFPSTKDKIVVTQEGFDASIQPAKAMTKQVKRLTDSPYFLYVGNAYPHKNVPVLVEGFREFKKKHNIPEDLKLILVGKDDFFYRQLSPEIMRDDIIRAEEVSDSELGLLYQHAIALVSASLVEGFGLPVLEAMSLSALVVASDIAPFHEICQDAALYFDPKKPGDIADVMFEALRLSSAEKNLRIEKGVKRSKAFSWERMVEETLKVYEDCNNLR